MLRLLSPGHLRFLQASNFDMIYDLVTYPDDSQKAVDFAVSASALKHTIMGDFNLVIVEEVEKLMKVDASGCVSR